MAKIKKKKGTRKGQAVTFQAPVLIVPDKDDKPTPVWMDRGEYMKKLSTFLSTKKWPIEEIKHGEGQLTIRFSKKDHAIMFLLSYEQYGY